MEPESEFFNPADPEDLQRRIRSYLESGHEAEKAVLYFSDDPDLIPIGDIVQNEGKYWLHAGESADRNFELGGNVSQLRIYEKTGKTHTFIAMEIYQTEDSYMKSPASIIITEGPTFRTEMSVYLR